MENLDLIDWRMVGFASLWILGLAIELTVLGFVDYHAKMQKRKFRSLLGEPGYQIWINFGLMLFCLGMLGSAKVWWETALWALLAAAFLYYTISAWQQSRRLQAGAQGTAAQEVQEKEQEEKGEEASGEA